MLIDTHAHINFNAFKEDADKVIKRTLKNNVWMINVGSQYESSKKAVEIAQRHKKGVYAAVGLHPIHTQDAFDYEKYKELAKMPKVVAVGEIGLDYKKEYISFKKEQKKIFLKQLDIAKELDLPFIFHCRQAHDDMIELLKLQVTNYNLQGVIHCFSGTWEQAQKYLEMGFYLGFNGIIFKIALDKVIEKIPLDKILIETDCPYLSPPPFENQRNEPLYVKYIAEQIAKIKKLSYEKIAETTAENAKKLFKI